MTAQRPRWSVLCLLAALPAAVEVVVVRLVGLSSAVGLVPAVTAPPPFGAMHDLRWIAVYHDSWWTLGGAVAAALLVRGALATAMVRLVVQDASGETWPRALGRNVLGLLVVVLALSPWAAASVGAAATSLFWFAVGEVVPLLGLSLLLGPAGLAPGWWRRLPSRQEVGWTALTFVWLTLGSLVVNATPGWWQVPVAAATAATNALLWVLLVRAGAVAWPRQLVPAAPLAVVLSGLVIVAMAPLSALGNRIARRPSPVWGLARAAPHVRLVYVPGYNSVLQAGELPGPPTAVEWFSYKGLGPHGNPLPYSAQQTHQSLDVSAALLAKQLTRTARASGKPIALLGQSEGSVVIRDYLQRYDHREVHTIVLVSPLIDPGRASYPPPSADHGWGLGTGWLLRGMFAVVRRVSGTVINPDEPFIRSMLESAPGYDSSMLCPAAGARTLAVLPLSVAVVVPPGRRAHVSVAHVAGVHGDVLGDVSVQRLVTGFLRDRPVGPDVTLGFRVVQDAAAAWQAPSLVPRLHSGLGGPPRSGCPD